MSHLEKSAVFAGKHLQIWRVDKDSAVDVLQAVSAEVERLQAPQLVEYSRGEFHNLVVPQRESLELVDVSEGGAHHGADFVAIETQLAKAAMAVAVTHKFNYGYSMYEK